MTDPEAALGALVRQALVDELGAQFAAADPLIRPSGFADYQSNVAMSLSRQLGRAPREIASLVAARLAGADAVASAEVSGPGFINITLSDEWIARQSSQQLADPRLGVAVARSCPADRRRLLRPECRQGAARRTSAGDRRRRRDRPGT